MAKKKNGTGVVTKVGYDNSGQTVVFLRGTSVEVFGADFRTNIDVGDYMWYQPEYTRNLVGKEVEFTFTSVDEKFIPNNIKFVNFKEEG